MVKPQKCPKENNEVYLHIDNEDDSQEVIKVVKEKESLFRKKCVDGNPYANLGDEEKEEWKKIFLKLGELDSAGEGAVPIKALNKIINRLEDKKNIFYIGPQADKKIQRFEGEN